MRSSAAWRRAFRALTAAVDGRAAQGGVSAPRKRMGRDPSDPKTSATDMLPDWIGYSMLYGVRIHATLPSPPPSPPPRHRHRAPSAVAA